MFLLEWAMQGVFERGTARNMINRLDSNLPLAGKTGTTNDLRDSWFAGYGSDLVGVVWLGHDDNRETGLTGSSGALRVWTDIMGRLDIQPRQSFAPSDIVFQRVAQQPVRSGGGLDCSNAVMVPFRTGQLPDPATRCDNADTLLDRLIDRVRNINP
jgi:penicillin-binding protein 1B